MEILFKNVSKAFQALVQDLNPDEIERMMWSLKQEKEELVKYRAVIPQKMYLTTQVSYPVLFFDDLLNFLYTVYEEVISVGASLSNWLLRSN